MNLEPMGKLRTVDLENTETGRSVLKAALLTGIGKAEDRDYDPCRRMVRLVMGHL